MDLMLDRPTGGFPGNLELLELCSDFGVELRYKGHAKLFNIISGARPDCETTAAVEVPGLDDWSDRGNRLSCDGINYTFDCAGGTI